MLNDVVNYELKNSIDSFIRREIKAKDVFYIDEICKSDAYEFVRKYHYLGDAKFFCQQAFGLFSLDGNVLLGVATYSQPQGGYSLKGWFGISNDNTFIYELSRLCMLPLLNGTNATSYLLGNSIKIIKKQGKIKAIISLANSGRHIGSIYQVCNFKYYGLTPQRNIFYTSTGKKNPRIVGKKNIHGVWVPMHRKHRYAYVLDDTIEILHKEQSRPSSQDYQEDECCIGCGGSRKVFDRRFNEWYTCPICTGKVRLIEDGDDVDTTIEKDILHNTKIIDEVEKYNLW